MHFRKLKKLFAKGKKHNSELPSFLLKLTDVPEEIDLPTKTTKSNVYLGAIFFGVCNGYHPPHHSLKLARFNLVQYIAPSRENFLDDILLSPETPKKPNAPSRPIKISTPRKKKLYDDPYPHTCPGRKRNYKQEFKVFEVDLGETTSKVTAETSREVQYCRVKNISSRTSQNDIELVTLSDIREKNRTFMTPNERAAHSHFPKEFKKVLVCGPKIPASISIQKIPSRRRKLSDYRYKVISKIKRKKELEDNAVESSKQKVESENYETPIADLFEKKSDSHSPLDMKFDLEISSGSDVEDVRNDMDVDDTPLIDVSEDEITTKVDEKENEELEEEEDEEVDERGGTTEQPEEDETTEVKEDTSETE